jgi:hypothetical protein
MNTVDIVRRPMSRLKSLNSDLPGILERIGERGDWSAKAVLILSPLWLTPQHYARLSKMRQPLKVLSFLWMAGSLWTLLSTLSFPQAFSILTPRVNAIGVAAGYWDPAWAGWATGFLFGVVTAGLFGASGVFNWATARTARRVSARLGFHPILPPPLGYHVLVASGHLASLSFIMLLVYAVFSVNAGLVDWLVKPEMLQSVLIVVVGCLALAVGIAARRIHTIRAVQIYGSVWRALAYQIPACVLLAMVFLLLRV